MSDLATVFSEIRQSGRLPILFVGSGISKRYTTNAYNWRELLVECIKEYDSEPIKKYLSYQTQAQKDADTREIGEEVYSRIGSMVEFDFNMAVYSGKIDMDVSDENSPSPLKRYLSETLSTYSIKEELRGEIELLQQLREKMLTVVTTNFDSFLEDHVFTSHRTVVGAPVFLGGEIGTLIKIHGSVSDPNSIILTHQDYEKLGRKSKVLVGKLIHLFTENPVVFLGYSLTDASIQRLLADIYGSVESSMDFRRLKERLIFVEYDPELSEGDVDVGELVKNVDDRSIYLTKIRLPQYTTLLAHMAEMQKITKLKEVLWLKDLVADLVTGCQGTKTKLIQLTDDADDSEGYSGEEVVVAIGKQKDFPSMLQDRGLKGLDAKEVFHDIIFDDMPAVGSENHLVDVLVNLAKQNSLRLPVHKYLRDYDGEIPDILKVIQSREPRDFLTNTINKDRNKFSDFIAHNSGSNLDNIYTSNLPISKKWNFLVLQAVGSDADELRPFVRLRYDELETSNSTVLRKLIIFLDIKEYKK